MAATAIQGPTIAIGIDSRPAQDGANIFKTAVDKIKDSGEAASNSTKKLTSSIGSLGSFAGQVASGGLEELATKAGRVTSALTNLGTAGTVVGGILGAIALATAGLAVHAVHAAESLSEIQDAADRAGTSASKLQELQFIFMANASSAAEASGALEFLQRRVAEASEGSLSAQRAFEAAGISMQRLSQIGGDSVLVLQEIAQKTGLTSDQLADLTGRAGKGLLPALQALREEGLKPVNTEFNDLVKKSDDAADASAKLSKQWQQLGAHDGVMLLELLNSVKSTLIDLVGWLNKTGDAMSVFWSRLFSKANFQNLDTLKQGINEALNKKPASYIPAGENTPYIKQETAPIEIKPAVDKAAEAAEAAKRKAAADAAREAKQELRDQERATSALESADKSLLQAQIALEQQNMNQLKALDLQKQELDLLHTSEVRKLDDLKLSAEQKARMLDLLNQKYALLNRTLDSKKNDILLKFKDTGQEDKSLTFEGNVNAQFPQMQMNDQSNIGNMIPDWERYFDIVNESNDATESLAKGTRSFVDDLSDGLVQAIVSGAKLQDIFMGLAQSIVQATMKALIFQTIMNAIGGAGNAIYGGGGAGATASSGTEMGSFQTTPIMHTGGIVGKTNFPTRLVSQHAFMGAPKFHSGGEVNAVLQRGEGVFTPEQMKAMGKSNVNVNIINNTNAQVSTQQKESNDGMTIEVLVDQVENMVAKRIIRNGTVSNSAVKNVGQLRAR
jgi:hypothetical protein